MWCSFMHPTSRNSLLLHTTGKTDEQSALECHISTQAEETRRGNSSYPASRNIPCLQRQQLYSMPSATSPGPFRYFSHSPVIRGSPDIRVLVLKAVAGDRFGRSGHIATKPTPGPAGRCAEPRTEGIESKYAETSDLWTF